MGNVQILRFVQCALGITVRSKFRANLNRTVLVGFFAKFLARTAQNGHTLYPIARNRADE